MGRNVLYAVLILGVGTSIISTWLLAGRAEGALELLSVLCWLVVGIFLLANPGALNPLRWSILWPWLGLAAIMAVGIANAENRAYIQTSGIPILIPETSYAWLPSALEKERSLKFSLFLTGILFSSACVYISLQRRSTIRIIATAIIVNGAALAVTGAVFKLSGASKILGRFPWTNDNFFATFRYYNHWVAYATLTFFLAAGLADYFVKRKVKDPLERSNPVELIFASTAVMLLGTMILAGSRAGILVAFAVFCVVAATFLMRAKAKLRWQVIVPTMLLLILALGIPSWTVRDEIETKWQVTRTEAEQIAENPLINQRFFHVWWYSYRMLREKPLTGWGYGSHLYAYSKFAAPVHRDSEGIPLRMLAHGHNDWMQYLSELGIVGFSLFILPLVLITRRLLMTRRMASFSSWTLKGVVLVLGLALIDYPLNNPAVMLNFSLILVLALRYWDLSGRKATRSLGEKSSEDL